jgi:hypothetical protein
MVAPKGAVPAHSGEIRCLTVQMSKRPTDAAEVEERKLGVTATTPARQSARRVQWWVECLDPFGRPRAMNVVLEAGRVRVVAPPGESGVLSAVQTRQLGDAIDQAGDHVVDHAE